ncbi:unnamed protein product [Urochloa humidicola]
MMLVDKYGNLLSLWLPSLTPALVFLNRVFDVFLNGNISNIGYSFKRLWKAALSIALARKPFPVCSARGFIRGLVFTIVLCPLFGLYLFGLFVSPLISLWRLLQQDYGDTAGDSSKANLKPALVVLYSLALFQGVLFYYKEISSWEEKRLVKLVAEQYALSQDDEARGSVSDYLNNIRIGCEKDPSFARGRNLITYAAYLMESNSPDNYLSGARILDTLIRRLPEHMAESQGMINNMVSSRVIVTLDQGPDMLESQRMVINIMIGSASSGDTLKKLVQMLDSKSIYDREIRLRAMRIVAHFATEIRLNRIPYGIQCISSFVNNLEACRHRPTCIGILWKLTNDEENLRLMSNTNGLGLRIITLLLRSANDELHMREHGKWYSLIAMPGMEVIKRFISVSKRSNNMQLHREILESTHGISILENMLHCERCRVKEELQISVILVLTQIIAMDASPAEGSDVRERFIGSLIGMFLDGSGNSLKLKGFAGESLAQLSLTSEISAQLILRTKSSTVSDLTKVLLDVNSKYRKIAADILKHLCSHYKADDKSFKKLKKAMISVIPEVLKEVLGCSSTAGASPSYTVSHPAIPAGYPAAAYPPWYHEYYYVEVQEALASLCKTVHERLINEDDHLTRRFATEICQDMHKEPPVSFAALVREAAEVVADNRRLRTTTFMPQLIFADEDPNACCIV